MTISHQTTFLFSTVLEAPDQFFQGYCFHGANYIFSDSGAREYRRATGKVIHGGEDGCYVSILKEGHQLHLTTDFSGNKKIFYYWSPVFWAASNSVALLITHLQENGIHLNANMAQLRAMANQTLSTFNQVYSYRTIADGVWLLPLGASLEIGDRGVFVRDVPSSTSGDYPALLKNFIDTWVARFETLLSNPGITLNMDLTGGMDSRTVFAIVQRAIKRIGKPKAHIRIRCGRPRGDDTDLKVSTLVCNRFGLQVNGPIGQGRAVLNAQESYGAWRDLCLGSYHPIYFPAATLSRDSIWIGGGGGENHRPFYKHANVEAFVSHMTRRIDQPELRQQLENEVRETLDRLSSTSEVDPIMLHYRHFRNRFHSGRNSQYTVNFSPLASGLLELASNCAGKEKMKVAQVSYDVMASTTPELMDMPFDKPHKTPTAAIRSQLTIVELEQGDSNGKIYGENETIRSASPSLDSQFDLLMADFNAAISDPYVKKAWPRDFMERAQKTLNKAVIRAGFEHAIDGQPISAIIASKLLSPAARGSFKGRTISLDPAPDSTPQAVPFASKTGT